MKDITTITDKDKENANIVFIVIIEEQSNAEDILFAIMAAEHVEVKDVFVNSYAQNMQISKRDQIDVLLTLNDVLSKTWGTIGLGSSFHITPIEECFTIFHVGNHGDVYLGKNHAWSIEGIIGTMHLTMDGTNELVYKM